MSKKKHRNIQNPPASNPRQPPRRIIRSEFHGPLPPPSTLAQYDQIQPGLADRIVSMAVEQSNHRKDMESKALGHAASEIRLGQIFGFSIAIFGLGCATLLGMYDHNWPAGVIGGGSLIGLVTAFLVRKRKPPEEPQ